MNKILQFWLRFLFVRLSVDEPGAGGGTGGSLLSGGGGNTPPDWRASLPDDVKGDPSLASIKDVGSLAKSYVHAQKLIGTDKIAKPNDKWTPEQWRGFYKELGVPETPDKYSLPEVKLAQGLTIESTKLDKFKKIFHDQGLTPKQVSAVMQAYMEDVNSDYTARTTGEQTARASAIAELKQEFGEKYDANLDIARSVLKKFGSDQLLEKLENTGLANDPEIIRMFYTIGQGMMEDRASGSGDGLLVQEATAALQEINRLKGDTDFQRQLNSRNDPGHKAAVQRWTELHGIAANSR